MPAAVRFAPGSNSIVEGLLIPFHGPLPGDKDVYATRFTPNTRYCLDWFPVRPLLYHHAVEAAGAGLPAEYRLDPIGSIKTEDLEIRVGDQVAVRSDEGIWAKAQLDANHKFFDEICDLLDEEALSFSHATMDHLIEIDERSGDMIQWPLCEGTLTPRPANLYAVANRAFRGVLADLKIEPSAEARPFVEGPGHLVFPDSEGMDAMRAVKDSDGFPASSYLVVEDPKTPSSWHLKYKTSAGKFDARVAGGSYAALTSNFRGKSYTGPNKAEALSKLKAAYKAAGVELPPGNRAAPASFDGWVVDVQLPDGTTVEGQVVESSRADKGGGLSSKFAHIDPKGGLKLPIHDADHIASSIKQFKGTSFPNADAKEAARVKLIKAAKAANVTVPKDELKDGSNGVATAAIGQKRAAPFWTVRANVGDEPIEYERSFEDIRSDIRQLLNGNNGDFPSMPYYTIVATFDDYVIVNLSDDDDDDSFWKISYTLDDSTMEPVLGDRVQMEQVYVPLPAGRSFDGHYEPLSLDAMALARQVEAFSERTKDLADRRLDEARPLSDANLRQLTAVRSALEERVKDLGTIVDATALHAAEVAKAADPVFWDFAQAELELAALFA